VVAGILLLAVACSKPVDHPYPKEIVENFVKSCETRAPRSACECAIDELQRDFTLEQFQGLEQEVAQGKVPKGMADAVATCTPR
jgi:hypothetical protein